LDDVDHEFALLTASVERTARVQLDEVTRFLLRAPRRPVDRSQRATADDALTGITPTLANDRKLRHGAVLAGHLSAAYEALLGHVEQRRSDYETLPDAEARRGAVTEMRQLVAGARSLHRSLAWLDAASEPPLDLGTKYFVDYVTARLVERDAELTVVSGERSYGKVADPLSPVFALSGPVPPSDGLAIVVFIPRREQRSGLLHPLIIHELGHAADDRHGLVQRVLRPARDDLELLPLLAAAAEAEAAATGGDRGAIGQALSARLAAWTEEAVCDAFATQLLGPTYLYSFMAIVGTSDLDRGGEEHPPTRQRIRLLFAQLEDLGWGDLMSTAEEVHSWFRQTADVDIDYRDAEERFCVEALDRLAPNVRAVVADHVGALTFSAEDFMEVREEVETLLQAGIPPSQTVARERIDRPAIILGSWLFAVQQMGWDLAGLAKAVDVPELSRLLPKALQDAALLEAWEERA
jgi:hypothetical protein